MEEVAFGEPHAQHALEGLYEWAMEHRDAWPTAEAFDRVLRATLADATKTFGAITSQTRRGYGPTALTNGRSLFESLVVAYWMTYCADHDWVIERLRGHLELGRRVLADAVRKDPDWWEAVGEPSMAEIENEDRLVALYGRFAEKSWWTNEVDQQDDSKWKVIERRSMRTLVGDLMNAAEVEGRLWTGAGEDKSATPLLQTMLDVPHRLNNQLVHHTPQGLNSLVDLADGELIFDDGPSSVWVDQAQLFGYVSFSLLVQLCIDRYRPDLRENFETAVNVDFARAWVTLSDEQQAFASKGANRNQPCPCGSGLKAKRCHRA